MFCVAIPDSAENKCTQGVLFHIFVNEICSELLHVMLEKNSQKIFFFHFCQQSNCLFANIFRMKHFGLLVRSCIYSFYEYLVNR